MNIFACGRERQFCFVQPNAELTLQASGSSFRPRRLHIFCGGTDSALNGQGRVSGAELRQADVRVLLARFRGAFVFVRRGVRVPDYPERHD